MKLNNQIWWQNNDVSVYQCKSTKSENDWSSSAIKYDEKITRKAFNNENQH
jgi:hypothetical protein